MRPSASIPLLALLAALTALSLAWGYRHAVTRPDDPSKDLMARWAEARAFVRGEDPYRLPSMTYPPSALPVFAPLVAPFGPAAVRAFWFGLNLIATAALCGAILSLVGRDWPAWLKIAFCLAVVASKPVRGGIALGQFHLIPTALMIGSVLALRARREVLAGVLVGVALAKPTMALPFLGLLAARRHGRALAAALGLQAALLLGASAWLRIGPGRLIREWLDTAKGQLAEGLIDVPSLVQRHWPAAPSGASAIALGVLMLGAALTFALRRASDFGLASLCALVAAISTYHRPYDLVLLIPALAYLIAAARRATGPAARALTAAAVAFAALLILPSHPSVAGSLEGLHDAVFIAMAYAYILLVVALLAGEAARAGDGDGVAVGGGSRAWNASP